MFRSVKNSDEITFVIVGVGMSGTSLFCQLVEKLILRSDNSKYKIMLFEKDPALFVTGLPYQTNTPNIWTLNNPAEKFKLTPNGISVASWMQENKQKWQIDQFAGMNEVYVPRALVGLYLKDQYELSKAKAQAHGIIVDEPYFEEVIDVTKDNECWQIMTKNQNEYNIDFLFMCLGHAPSNHYPQLESKPNYFSSHSVEELKQIPNDASICILGGQATFVDIALWLAYDKHHAGVIHTVTRHPSVITTKGNQDVCDKTPVEELTSTLKTNCSSNSLPFAEGKLLFWNAYKKAAKSPIDLNKPPTTKAALTYQLAKYNKSPILNSEIGNVDELRSFVFSFYMSGCYSEFWNKLNEEGKGEFNKQLYSLLMFYLTGITPLNASLLLELYNRDQIHEQHGLIEVNYDDKENKFVLYFNDKTTRKVDYLIDSSGYGYDVSQPNPNYPLLTNLVKKGYVTPKKFGGIMSNDCGQAFNNEGCLQENFICIGPIPSYGHKFPTPYASFIAVEAVEKALLSMSSLLKVSLN